MWCVCSGRSATVTRVWTQVNVLFTIELLLHTVARGFIFGRDAYLQQERFQLDFVIVVFSWLQAVPGDGCPPHTPHLTLAMQECPTSSPCGHCGHCAL